MSDELSKTAYNKLEEAAMGGFSWVLARGPEWERKEFGFWVILKTDKKVAYHYTTPESGSGVRVTLTMPTGLNARAFCHTHPKSDDTGDFSADDLDSFRKVAKLEKGIAFFLMNPYREIRYARAEGDFLRGKPLAWVKGINP
jgi:hypothetical protein